MPASPYISRGTPIASAKRPKKRTLDVEGKRGGTVLFGCEKENSCNNDARHSRGPTPGPPGKPPRQLKLADAEDGEHELLEEGGCGADVSDCMAHECCDGTADGTDIAHRLSKAPKTTSDSCPGSAANRGSEDGGDSSGSSSHDSNVENEEPSSAPFHGQGANARLSTGSNMSVAEEYGHGGEADIFSPVPKVEVPQEAQPAPCQQEPEADDDDEEFDAYSFIKTLPPYNTVKHFTPKGPVLPARRLTRHSKRNTLVLDLDETLVHCSVEPTTDADHVFYVHFNGEDFQVYVRKRPNMDKFLAAVAEMFEVVVFTASQKVYAETLLDKLDPEKKYIKHRLYRDACMHLEGNYLKDLNVLGRDLSSVALVDNSPYAYSFQLDNGIPIESWFDDQHDDELMRLVPFLKQIHDKNDVRPLIRKVFNTPELVARA